MRLFSYKNRPVHLGPYPLERLARTDTVPDWSEIPPRPGLDRQRRPAVATLGHAMRDFQALLDAIRGGLVNTELGDIPSCPDERARHIKSHCYFYDASQVGCCALDRSMLLDTPIENPDIGPLLDKLGTTQTKTFATGFDVILQELQDTVRAPALRVEAHSHAVVFLYEYPRDPTADERGSDWILQAQQHRAALRAAETASIIANYLRMLGYEAKGHTESAADIELNKLVVAAGLGRVETHNGRLVVRNPYLGQAFGVGAVTTSLAMAVDKPLAAPGILDRWRSHGPAWWLGLGFAKNRHNHTLYKSRAYVDGLYPFETLARNTEPSTFIDEARVARVPKRTDMFARGLFGDLGNDIQQACKGGYFARKSVTATAPNLPMGGLTLLQNGPTAATVSGAARNPQHNADNVKAAAYFLGADAVGISRCPEWVYYSHDANGEPIQPYHTNAISIVIDQGHETMEGASGDDWIACAQSMRAYQRFALLGGVIAQQIRDLGYEARVHSANDGEVLQPPLLLLSGLGEVSRIGEVILNPFLGPRLKSGVVTTNMPLAHDLPIDFGLQAFCDRCNKCARECPSGAISAGPKLMFNGYEIWKSDAEKCTRYRTTNPAGSMCGRCMKTCPWNLEGVFKERPFRWLAMRAPRLGKWLARLDDRVGNGEVNPVKNWWWDLEITATGGYGITDKDVNRRALSPSLALNYRDQTLAAYPAHLAPPPYPFPSPLNREAGINAYRALLTPEQYRQRLAAGETVGLVPIRESGDAGSPVIQVEILSDKETATAIKKYDLIATDGGPLPPFDAGAHIDVLVAPEYIRQYSLAGDPADRSSYKIGVLREAAGRGGSDLLHKIFTAGRKVFISKPKNHFPLLESAQRSYLMAGGIGITPLIAMAHRLFALGRPFELHYSCGSRMSAGFVEDLQHFAWADRVHYYFSDQGRRADLRSILSNYCDNYHLYTCGASRYMDAVIDAGRQCGWPEQALHREYFSAPEPGEYTNSAFTLLLTCGQKIPVSAQQSASDALQQAGFAVTTKCSQGICGSCAARLVSGEVEHRDHVLSARDRAEKIILCCSRAAPNVDEIVIEL